MSVYLQCLPGEIVIRESSPEPDDTGTDRVVAAVTAAELLEIVADYRRRKQSEAESRAAFAAEMDRRLALVVAKEDSPVLVLLKHVWKHEGHGSGQSWARLNGAMGSALGLAIRSGLRFDVDDFATFAKDFNSCRWIGDAEWCYSAACGAEHGDHGGNPSAVQSFEAWTGRKPFLVRYEPRDKTPKRLYVGSRFQWWDGKKLAWVHLTSFDDSKGTCVAVERKYGSYETKIVRRHTLTHDKIKAYHAEIKDRMKAEETAGAAP